MGYGQLDNDVTDQVDADQIETDQVDTDQIEENPELTNLREENRRLYELVERLIASQESEQAHRKAIEAELQEMKSSLIEQASAERSGDGVGVDPSSLSQDLEKLVAGLGESLEERLSTKIEGLEGRILELSDAPREPSVQPATDPDAIANATWKMIAPLGEELERLSGRVADLSGRVTERGSADGAMSGDDVESSLATLLEELGQANGKLVTSAQDAITREREEMRDVLETRLSEVGKTMEELLARQDDTQSQTLTLLRGLVDSHIGRLSTEWASQIDGLKRAVDDLRLGQVALLNPESERTDGAAEPVDPEQLEPEAGDTSENVVSAEFPAFKPSQDKPLLETAEEKPSDKDKTAAMSPGLRREMQAMEILSEPKVPESDEASDAEEAEDALLTEPADWRAEAADEDGFDLSRNGVAVAEEKASEEPGETDTTKPESVDGRGIDLRAYKDLRLTSGSAEADSEAGNGSAKPAGQSYENAPAEASLTRFVRMIRARKRSTTS